MMFFDRERTEVGPIRTEVDPVGLFLKSTYPDLVLKPAMLEQLSWLQTNSVVTSQSHVQAAETDVNAEVKRVLSRLYCLRLMLKGDEAAYQCFVLAQPSADRLSAVSFSKLSAFVKDLSPAAYQCLEATCFITKSDRAIAMMPQELALAAPADSEKFITYLISHAPEILPIYKDLGPEARALLTYAFYPQAHARHMLDMEGGHNMLATLIDGIKNKTINKAQFDLWFSRWIVNIAGLDGHIKSQGSVYLTQPVADCIFALKGALDELWKDTAYPVLETYLQFRAAQLQVQNPFIAYFAALMRQYSPAVGIEIQTWFESLSPAEQVSRRTAFDEQLANTIVTPSFKPTVLLNLLALGCSTAEALTIFVNIEAQAMQTYTTAIAAGQLTPNEPLSFRKMALKEVLSSVVAYYNRHHQLPVFSIGNDKVLEVTHEVLCAMDSTKPAVGL
jgi:hypothetical protein